MDEETDGCNGAVRLSDFQLFLAAFVFCVGLIASGLNSCTAARRLLTDLCDQELRTCPPLAALCARLSSARSCCQLDASFARCSPRPCLKY